MLTLALFALLVRTVRRQDGGTRLLATVPWLLALAGAVLFLILPVDERPVAYAVWIGAAAALILAAVRREAAA